MTDMDQIIREDARLIVLKALSEQTDERLNSSVLLEIIETYGGIRKTREWLHTELDWMNDMGAVKTSRIGTIVVAALTERGAQHLDRIVAIEGIKRPGREG